VLLCNTVKSFLGLGLCAQRCALPLLMNKS
jgi:hypothetical protein